MSWVLVIVNIPRRVFSVPRYTSKSMFRKKNHISSHSFCHLSHYSYRRGGELNGVIERRCSLSRIVGRPRPAGDSLKAAVTSSRQAPGKRWRKLAVLHGNFGIHGIKLKVAVIVLQVIGDFSSLATARSPNVPIVIARFPGMRLYFLPGTNNRAAVLIDDA